VPKFELYKHNDELFNIYYRIFYELLPILTDSICSNGGHLGYRTALTDTILKGDHLRIITAKFGWDWLSSFNNAKSNPEIKGRNSIFFRHDALQVSGHALFTSTPHVFLLNIFINKTERSINFYWITIFNLHWHNNT
jgi:hypothetical protein